MILKYVLAWFGMMMLAILNGTVRDFVYKPYVGDLAAHQISTVILLLLFAGYIWWLTTKWPLTSAGQACTVGIIWFLMTEAFEFGLGLRRGMTWEEMLYTYNLLEGQLWIFIPVWVLVGPYLCFRIHARNSSKNTSTKTSASA